jgi:hypothetical protein
MSQLQYDISLGANSDLFNDTTMNSTITTGAGGGVWGVQGTGGTLLGAGTGIYTTGTALPPYTINTGAAGQTLMWNGTSPTWDTITTSTMNGELYVKGDAEIEGDLKIKGKSLADAIDNIEKRLAILHPNKDLEERWEQLKALGEHYRELEKDILEKEKIWNTLKK